MNGLMDMKIATGRVLVCIGQAKVPLSAEKLTAAIAAKYDKLHDEDTVSSSIAFLQNHRLVDPELKLTPHGAAAYELMLANGDQNGWAFKFFRKSNSPNIGSKVRAVVANSQPHHASVPGLMVVR